MKIVEMHLAGHPLFEDATLPLRPQSGTGIAALLGAPGAGKTALLETLVAAKEDAAPTGARTAFRTSARTRNDSCKVLVRWQLAAEEQHLVGGEAERVSELIFSDETKLPEGADDDGLRTILGGQADEAGWFLYFDEGRMLPPMSVGRSATAARKSGPRFIERDFDKFGFVRPFLLDLAQAQASGVGLLPGEGDASARDEERWSPEAFSAALEEGTGCRFVGMRRAGGPCPIFRVGSRIVPYDELPSSTREWLIFLGTYFHARPDPSVVLIDAPEARLGVDGGARLLRVLAGLGKDNQLLVATSSEALARAVEVKPVPIPQVWRGA